MDNDGEVDKMNDISRELFFEKVSPELVSKMRGEFSKDPLEFAAERCDHMSDGLLTMLEAALMLNGNAIDTQLPELREQFTLNVKHLREAVREGNSISAQQKLDDIIKTFISYRRVSQGLFGRLTNVISEFPKYSAELNSVSADITAVREQLMHDKVLILGDDEIKKLAFELYKLLVATKEQSAKDNVAGEEKSAEELMDEKRTVADKIGGDKRV